MEISIIFSNFIYAFAGATFALLFMIIGYKLFDKITPFDTSAELSKQNIAVGIVVGSMFVGLGTAIGLVIGLGLN